MPHDGNVLNNNAGATGRVAQCGKLATGEILASRIEVGRQLHHEETFTKSLAERFKDGDETAISEIYHLYSDVMFVRALRLLKDRELAAEAVQQAFVKAWKAAASFNPHRELRPWLYVLVRHAAVDAYRQARRSQSCASLDEFSISESFYAASCLDLEEVWLIWQVRRALQQLQPDERQVIQMTYYSGYSQREISQRLGVAVGTVNNRIARGRERLRQLLAHLRDVSPNPP
ncbi:RNA polymerase sigma factor [Streptomyces sp. NPDC055109]